MHLSLKQPVTLTPGCVNPHKTRTVHPSTTRQPSTILVVGRSIQWAGIHKNTRKKTRRKYITSVMTSMSPINTVAAMSGDSSHGGSVSPRLAAPPKNVAFELLFLDSPQYRARLPMRVQIYPHDTTDSIVTTVKNFYGLYSGPTGSKGVSFEDQHGNTLIARYENFRNNMVVYVRVIEEPPVASTGLAQQSFHPSPIGNDGYYPPPQSGYQDQHHQHYDQDMGRPSSRASRRRSTSPNGGRGRRSDSVSTTDKQGRSRSTKSRRSLGQSQADGYESANGYSSGDGAPSTASARAKELLGTTDISVENIVEGGRRKRAKFESSVSAP